MDYVIVGIFAFFVSIGSAIAGGGGGLVMTPLILLLGFPPQAALASTKAAGLGVNAGALTKFSKEKNVIDWRLASQLAVLAIIASIIGTQVVFIFDAEALRRLVGLITVALVPIFFFSRKLGLGNTGVSRTKKIIGIILYFIIMTAQAGLGSGIGSLLMFVLMGLMGFDALRANATKRVVGLVLVSVSFIVFAFSGYMDWWLALSLGIGMLLGGYAGAHIAVKHGNKLVKKALLGVSLVMGLSILLT